LSTTTYSICQGEICLGENFYLGWANGAIVKEKRPPPLCEETEGCLDDGGLKGQEFLYLWLFEAGADDGGLIGLTWRAPLDFKAS
jgi:hypothetical protein